MTRPSVDEDLCIGCGRCEELYPAVFEVRDHGYSHVIDAEGCEAAGCCEEAAEECPVDAISLKSRARTGPTDEDRPAFPVAARAGAVSQPRRGVVCRRGYFRENHYLT